LRSIQQICNTTSANDKRDLAVKVKKLFQAEDEVMLQGVPTRSSVGVAAELSPTDVHAEELATGQYRQALRNGCHNRMTWQQPTADFVFAHKHVWQHGSDCK
jgi:hypothetical protein